MLGGRKISSQVPHPTCQLRHVTSRCVTARGTYRYNAVPEPINRSNATPAMDAGYVDEMQNQLHPESYRLCNLSAAIPPPRACMISLDSFLASCSLEPRSQILSRTVACCDADIFLGPFLSLNADVSLRREIIIQSVVGSFKYQRNIFVPSKTDTLFATVSLLK